MTPSAIIALVKDAVIIIAIGLIAYVLITYGMDVVKVSDMKAVEKQITQNAADAARWQKEASDANTKRDADLAAVAATISSHRDPVYLVRNAPRAEPVPGHPSKTGDQASGTGGTDAGSRINRRPDINAYEMKVETALADCYAGLDQWPVSK
jgi:hypothetical protein